MSLIIASWNIEKNGKSSTDIKQQKVSTFIDSCCKDLNATVVFLCEVHSAQIENYVSYSESVYGKQYNVYSLKGGHSNAYVVLIQKSAKIEVGQDSLKGLNRGAIVLNVSDIYLILAHFKSGQNGLTKDQIQEAANFLQEIGKGSGRWAITGDMNWDYKKANELKCPNGAKPYTCWDDKTQVKGGILDWCLAGSKTAVSPVDVSKLFPSEMNDMEGPDHRAVIFSIE